MPDIFAALPARPLHARPPASWWNAVWSLLGLAMFAAMLAYLVGWVAPGIVTDWQVRPAATVVRGARVADGKCDGKLFIEVCDATLTAPAGTATLERRVHYVFGSFSIGDFTVRVVADPAHPGLLTTDLALDVFWNRVLTFLVASALLSAAVVGGTLGTLRSRRTRRGWLATPAVAVPLLLKSVQRVRGAVIWTVQDEAGRSQRWTLPRRSAPFVLGPASRVLGLATERGALMPLDAGLRWVDLTPAERATALAAAGMR